MPPPTTTRLATVACRLRSITRPPPLITNYRIRAFTTASTPNIPATSTASATPRARATSLLHTIQYTHPPSCPCHGNPSHPHHNLSLTPSSTISLLNSGPTGQRAYASTTTTITSSGTNDTETAFEMAASSVRFGKGCTSEAGMDLVNILLTPTPGKSPPILTQKKRVLVLTDPNILRLPIIETVISALSAQSQYLEYSLFSDVHVEPKDFSVKSAIEFGRNFNADAYLAVGGGSVMDTAKMVNLYTSYPAAEFLDFVNAPLGKGLPITKPLKPLICVPTTAGTGSETTGTAIFDFVSKKAKTGISHRYLKPTLGLIDPDNTQSLPSTVASSCGLDVLFHSLESYTAIPYSSRSPRPTNPILRPAYQGANPISDVFSLHAMKMCVEYLPIVVHAPAVPAWGNEDPVVTEAREKMLLAATLAGIGFGNAGVHLCHGMSYPISGLNPAKYSHPGYVSPSSDSQPKPVTLIPHGVSVAVTAPSVFHFTAPSNPTRHLQAAQIFGADISRARDEDAGEILSDTIKNFLIKLGDQPRGLKELGFSRGDIEELVKGTVPQRRVLQLAPRLSGEKNVAELQRQKEELAGLFENAMEW